MYIAVYIALILDVLLLLFVSKMLTSRNPETKRLSLISNSNSNHLRQTVNNSEFDFKFEWAVTVRSLELWCCRESMYHASPNTQDASPDTPPDTKNACPGIQNTSPDIVVSKPVASKPMLRWAGDL